MLEIIHLINKWQNQNLEKREYLRLIELASNIQILASKEVSTIEENVVKHEYKI